MKTSPIEELLTHPEPQQPRRVWVLSEDCGVEAGLYQVHPQEPAEQEVAVSASDGLAESPHTAHRVQSDEQGRLQSFQEGLRWDGSRPTYVCIRSNWVDSSARALMVRKGWPVGARATRSTKASPDKSGSPEGPVAPSRGHLRGRLLYPTPQLSQANFMKGFSALTS